MAHQRPSMALPQSHYHERTHIMRIKALGTCSIYDTSNNVPLLISHPNAIHPLNLSVALGRGLAGMPNANCFRMAFGTGGTTVAGLTYEKNDPNITNFANRLYNEVYSEIIDATAIGLLSTGDGTVPENDDSSVLFESGPGCRISVDVPTNTTTITIECHINPKEPLGQTILAGNVEDTFFEFDEIGIFTKGKPSISVPGYQYIDLDNSPTKTSPKSSSMSTGLVVDTTASKYFFRLVVDENSQQLIKLDFSTLKTAPTYGQLVARINAAILSSFGSQVATASISNITQTESITSADNTFGRLKITSSAAGDSSKITILDNQSTDTSGYTSLVVALSGTILPNVSGQSAGVALNARDSTLEAERLLCHLRFDPIKKARDVSLKVVYEIALTVLPTDEI